MKNLELIDNYEFENALMIQERINQLEKALEQYPDDKFLEDQLKISREELQMVIGLSKQTKINRRIEINIKDYSPSELGTIYAMLNKLCGEDDRISYESFDE